MITSPIYFEYPPSFVFSDAHRPPTLQREAENCRFRGAWGLGHWLGDSARPRILQTQKQQHVPRGRRTSGTGSHGCGGRCGDRGLETQRGAAAPPVLSRGRLLLPGEGQSALLGPSADWTTPTHIPESHLLSSKPTYFNLNAPKIVIETSRIMGDQVTSVTLTFTLIC